MSVTRTRGKSHAFSIFSRQQAKKYVCVTISVCLSVPVRPSVCLSIHRSISQSMNTFIYLYIYQCINPSSNLSIHRRIYPMKIRTASDTLSKPTERNPDLLRPQTPPQPPSEDPRYHTAKPIIPSSLQERKKEKRTTAHLLV